MTRLALDELGAATAGIGAMHRSVANSVFGALGAVFGRQMTSPRMVHDAVSESTYLSVAALLDIARSVSDQLPASRATAPSRTTRGATVLGILNGLIGDALTESESSLAADMSVRAKGGPVAITTRSLARAFPDAGDHLVVFLHGLMETEHAWSLGGNPTYGERLRADIGASPVYIRYNTGLHISENGRQLADLLNGLTLLWPTPVARVTLVGHSMGGLVIRAACHAGTQRGDAWTGLVTETACLGTPHLGAPLARGVHAASTILDTSPVTRPISTLLRRRSAGVRDLFHGSLTSDDQGFLDRDRWQRPPVTDLPLLAGARHLYVTASLSKDPDHPLGRFIGDGLVLTPSGRGSNSRRHVGFRLDDGVHIGGAHHFTLLNDDNLYGWLRSNIAPRRALPPGRSA
ncbi:hypothetical protein GS4_05_01440 [Gordonia soli NBRC 108243]|uniref:GPI inositol-deacylase PGAP1-like alpha/beta domain-containing protein n=1 Tax=Gordonia soli NBRC 108243 TaxID=1223545 RepID=M0QEC1_9ACTN|nr:hypothetical protein GS4_05_01440 [Gordonia soli NBRC 108243]